MKVILLKDISKVGKKYDIKDVADGFATNMLIPRGMAQVATDASVKKILQDKEKNDAERKVQEDLLLKNLKDLNDKEIVIEESANEQGHLFAGIDSEELSKIIEMQTGQAIPTQCIDLQKPIKEIGEHNISVSIGESKSVVKIFVKAK